MRFPCGGCPGSVEGSFELVMMTTATELDYWTSPMKYLVRAVVISHSSTASQQPASSSTREPYSSCFRYICFLLTVISAPISHRPSFGPKSFEADLQDCARQWTYVRGRETRAGWWNK